MLFDTDIFIWLQKGNQKAAKLVESTQTRHLSLQTYLELMQMPLNKKQQMYECSGPGGHIPDTAEAGVTRRGVGRGAAPRRGTVAFAVVGMTQERAALGDPPRRARNRRG